MMSIFAKSSNKINKNKIGKHENWTAHTLMDFYTLLSGNDCKPCGSVYFANEWCMFMNALVFTTTN